MTYDARVVPRLLILRFAPWMTFRNAHPHDLMWPCTGLYAAALAEEPGLKRYLELRSEALLTDDYRASDMAWLDMRDNGIDVVIGPIESYEDQLLGRKTAHEAYVLVKDKEWSARLSR